MCSKGKKAIVQCVFSPNWTMRNGLKHKCYVSICPWGFWDLEQKIGIKN